MAASDKNGKYVVLGQKDEQEMFAIDVLTGLSAAKKTLPSKYIYDDDGSGYFEQIMDLPEYYPTRCEREIFTTYKTELASAFGNAAFNLVELGAGDGRKTRILLDEMQRQEKDFVYVPLDISELAIKHLISNVSGTGALKIEGIVGDYFRGLRWLKKNNSRRTFVLFLGSTIGNFQYPEAVKFLISVWNSLRHGDLLLLGVDLKKDISTLNAAYNDKAQVTKRFNLNLLSRINRELGGNFVVENFDFYAGYNPESGAVESYLVSQTDQQVYIESLEHSFTFRKWECIHTEYSFKYFKEEVEALAIAAGFKVIRHYTDSKGYYTDTLLEVVKGE